MSGWRVNNSIAYIRSGAKYKFIDYKFQMIHPFTCVISGPTMSGKSYFVKRLINLIPTKIDTKIDEIHYYYSVYQSLFDDMTNVEFIKGLPSLSSYDGKKNVLVIMDDLMSEINTEISDFFTKGAHHKNLSIIYICQNIFHQNRAQRTINLNSQYLILFKNPRDVLQIQYLGRSLLGRDIHEFEEIFLHATSKAHGYLFIDLKQSTPDQFRYLTYILNDHPKSSHTTNHIDVYVLNRFINKLYS